ELHLKHRHTPLLPQEADTINSRHLIRIAVAATCLTSGAMASAKPDARVDAALRDVLHSYETALNAKDLEAILSLYGSEPVFMPQHSSALAGRDAVRAGYQHVFETIQLSIRFEIHEIQQTGDCSAA